jgi:hypothetical protein
MLACPVQSARTMVPGVCVCAAVWGLPRSSYPPSPLADMVGKQAVWLMPQAVLDLWHVPPSGPHSWVGAGPRSCAPAGWGALLLADTSSVGKALNHAREHGITQRAHSLLGGHRLVTRPALAGLAGLASVGPSHAGLVRLGLTGLACPT